MAITRLRGNKDSPAGSVTDEELVRQLRLIADSSPDVLFSYVLPQGPWLYISPSVTQLCGYGVEEAMAMPCDLFLTPASLQRLNELLLRRTEAYMAGEGGAHSHRDELELICKDGSLKWCDVTTQFIQGDSGNPTLTGVVRPVWEHATVERELRASEERYRKILDSIEEGYYECDLHGAITFFNDAACRMLGYSREEFSTTGYEQLYKDPKAVFHKFNLVYRTGQAESGFTTEMLCKDDSSIFVEISISLQRDHAGEICGFRGVARDITERIHFLQKLEYFSMHDQLTGLYNRNYFEEELKRLEKSREFPISMISSDLNGLKLINDTMGHERGDLLLQSAAEVMRQSLRGSDVLARVGGDEFAAILHNTDEKVAEIAMDRIRHNIKVFNEEHDELHLSLSLGVATAHDSAISFQELFKRADDTMYRDKFSPTTGARNKIIKSLLTALAEKDYIADGHGKRLSRLCRLVGDRFELSPRQLANLTLLAQVHDLGNVGISEKILFKKGPLTEEEWKIIKEHPEKGYRIALSSNYLTWVANLILKHHERWDGSGYPLGLRGREVPVECRILAVVDAYDVMTNARPYREVKSVEEALREIDNMSGKQFDPAVVEVFKEVIAGELKS